MAPFLCPELRLWLLPPDAPSWHRADPDALDMPYWAFAWPGGQALARFVLDHPERVRGRRVLDFGCGGAIEGVAAALAGADVLASELDALALEVAARNAQENGVTLRTVLGELVGRDVEADVILAGDVCYQPELAASVVPWLQRQAARGVEVLVGDPLRVPGALDGARRLATYAASFDGDPRGLTRWDTHVLALTP